MQPSPTILLYDDDVDNIYLIRRYVETAGCCVVVTACSTELAKLFGQVPIALMLINMHLIITRQEEQLLEKLLVDPVSRHIPVFLCSSSEIELQSWKDIVNGSFVKPILYPEFVTILADVGIKPR